MTIPGRYLKDLRERLGLGVRDVQKASALIAAEEQNPEFYISAARLSQIENENSPPSVFKIFSICAIYGIDFIDLLTRYGANPDRIHHYREYLKLDATHPVAVEAHSLDTMVILPVRMDPSFRWDTTQLLNRVVALWGKVPAVLLQEVDPRRQMYGFIGLADLTMYPLLRPGTLVLIDGDRRRVAQTGWAHEYERPIYFIELREGYRCAWCQVDEARLTLLPHPMSSVAAESFRFPVDAEIVGQVVGVAMRIVPARPPD
jgi:transcriptional regulator with XRE-family HTH domain